MPRLNDDEGTSVSFIFYCHPQDKLELVTGDLLEIMALNAEGDSG